MLCTSIRRHTRLPLDWSSDVFSSELSGSPRMDPAAGLVTWVLLFDESEQLLDRGLAGAQQEVRLQRDQRSEERSVGIARRERQPTGRSHANNLSYYYHG